jgi:calcineurin-like phosphoesterase family protein
VYFTADLHLGHKNLLRHRPQFQTVEEMDEALIENWNDRVTDDDTVYLCGDFSFRSHRSPESYLAQLAGKKILIRGNHDLSWLKKTDPAVLEQYFEGIYDFHMARKNGVLLRFSHYPMISWENSRHGSLLICGHIHNQTSGIEYELFRQIPFAWNAGVDINDFRPVTLPELIENNLRFYRRTLSAEEKAVLEQDCLRIME